MIKVQSDKYSIIESGMAMTYDEKADLVIKVDLLDRIRFNVVLTFQEADERRMIIIADDEDTIRISFNSFSGPVGFGTGDPIEIQTKEGDMIYLRLWITRMGDGIKAKKVEYVFFKEIMD